MKETDLLIFDFDGTLADTSADIVKSTNYTLQALGLKERAFDTIVSFIGGGIDLLLLAALGKENEGKLSEAHDIYIGHQKEHFLDHVTLYPHVKETLGHFKGKRLAIASNRYEYTARRLLEALGVADPFEAIIGGDDANCRKPSPCQIENIMKMWGIPEEKTVMVGDMDYDILSGKAAGVATCAVTYGLGKREELKRIGPDFMIDDISELKGILR